MKIRQFVSILEDEWDMEDSEEIRRIAQSVVNLQD